MNIFKIPLRLIKLIIASIICLLLIIQFLFVLLIVTFYFFFKPILVGIYDYLKSGYNSHDIGMHHDELREGGQIYLEWCHNIIQKSWNFITKE